MKQSRGCHQQHNGMIGGGNATWFITTSTITFTTAPSVATCHADRYIGRMLEKLGKTEKHNIL